MRRKNIFLIVLIFGYFFLFGCTTQTPTKEENNKQTNLATTSKKTSETTLENTVKKSDLEISCQTCEYCKIGKQKEIENFYTDKNIKTCQECSFDNDCIENFTCNNNFCIHKRNIETKKNCQNLDNETPNCEHLYCEGCITQNPKCIISKNEWNSNKCIDCNSDYDCRENYVCRNFTCIKTKENINKSTSTTNTTETKILVSEIPYYDNTEENNSNLDRDTKNYETSNPDNKNNIENYNIENYFCGRIDCFENKFASCNSRIIFENTSEFINTRYEIIAYESNKCKLKMKYLKYPSQELLNKEMFCLYDNKKDFFEAEKEVMNNIKSANCTGELAELLKMF